MTDWQPIETAPKDDFTEKVDLWLQIAASALSLGWSDSFRVVDAFRREGKWVHIQRGEFKEINSTLITHWALRPKGPNGEDCY